MITIEHRINTVSDLERVPADRGVEIDLRSAGQHVVLTHEPFRDGERLEAFLRSYHHRLLVLNVKTEGIEDEVLRLVHAQGIEHYFFLDLPFPAMYRLARAGNRRLAVRFSEAEPLEGCLALEGLVEWVWVDCFTRLPLTEEAYARLHGRFRLCLVSPEIQGHPKATIDEYRRHLQRSGMALDAVCTDFPAEWEAGAAR